MKALITGGAGFIGTHLAEHLSAKGFEITIFDILDNDCYFDFDFSSYQRVRGDVENYPDLEKAAYGCDVIFHLAGLLGTDFLIERAEAAVQTNIIGTLNVLEAARANKALVVYLSLLPDWDNPYMITKNAAAKFCQMYYREFGLKTIVIRATHIYGERQRWEPVRKAVPNFIIAALQQKPLTIYGSGEQLMDLLYVKDAVQAIASSIERPAAIGNSIELGSGEQVRVTQLARTIIDLCGGASILEFEGKRPGEPHIPDAYYPADTTQQKKVLGFVPSTTLLSGLQKTIGWYRRIIS